MKPVVIYSLGRLGIIVGLFGLLWLVGLRGFALIVIAFGLSIPLSYVLLAKQRQQLGLDIEQHLDRRRERKADIRTRLSGENKPAEIATDSESVKSEG